MSKARFVFLVMVLVAHSQVALCDSPPWSASPQNWNNSPYNFENSPNNYANSPRNFRNSQGTRGRLSIVNFLGLVIGYAVVKSDGGINYFDNDGTRIGYSVDGGKTQYDTTGAKTSFTVKVEE